jgi:hypothetical protein
VEVKDQHKAKLLKYTCGFGKLDGNVEREKV